MPCQILPSGDDDSDGITELEFSLSDQSYFFVALSADRASTVRLED